MARRNLFKHAQQKRYKDRNYRNPNIKTSHSRLWRKMILPLGIFCIAILLLLFFFAHPFFHIQSVAIHGTEHIDRDALERAIAENLNRSNFFLFRRSNIFLFSPEDLVTTLESIFALASVTTTVQERTVYIRLEERTSNLLWRSNQQVFVVDLEGIVVREILDADDQLLTSSVLEDLPVFIDKNNVPLEVGDLVLTSEEVTNVLTFLTYLLELDIPFLFIEIDRVAGKWVQVQTQVGYQILIDIMGDMDAQHDHLMVVLDEIEEPSALQYIDLRFGERVYYK